MRLEFTYTPDDLRELVIPETEARDSQRYLKRSEQLEQARAILQNKIPKTAFLVQPTGFAVLPMPVLPIEERRGDPVERAGPAA